MRHSIRKAGLVLAAACAVAPPAFAQVDQAVTPPPNIVLSNYNSVPVGPFGGLEGQAVVARVGDPSAAWFNPAGLAQEAGAQISGSAGVYQRTAVAPTALPNTGSSVQQLPNLVGFTLKTTPRLTLGFAALTTNAWRQEIDAELITGTAAAGERFAYSADSDFSRRVFALAAGYSLRSGLRVGGGLALAVTDLRQVETAGDRVASTTGLQSLLISGRGRGTAFQLRTHGGVQYERSHLRLGATVRTPGATIMHSGALTLDSIVDLGASSVGASLFDPDAAFEYHLPWEFQGGGAYVSDRFQVEAELQTFGSISPYTMLGSAQPTLVYGDTGRGVPPSVTARPFTGLTTAADTVVNGAVGGQVRLVRDRQLRLHAGVASDNSPATADDQVLEHVDMLSWTIGVSGAIGKLQFAIGVNHRSGTADDVIVRNLLRNNPVRTAIDIQTTGLIYSLAYQF